MLIVSLDIETAPGEGFEDYEDAALDMHRNKITQIAFATSEGDVGCISGPYSIDQLNVKLFQWRRRGAFFGGQNFKFDLRTLITKGANLTSGDYQWDTMLQASANPHKIPDQWLADYNEARKALNKQLGADTHRESGKHGLKTLAPFHLGIEPFWEAANHDDPEYAMKDAKYTLALYIKQKEILEQVGVQEFYEKKLMRWARMLLAAELRGVKIDVPSIIKLQQESEVKRSELAKAIEAQWSEPKAAYEQMQIEALQIKYEEMKERAQAKGKDRSTERMQKIEDKYNELFKEAIKKLEPLNLSSPTQMAWLLRDYYGLDITDYEGQEGTGAAVLEKLAADGREDVKLLLDYREQDKLATSFFPTYLSMHVNETLHPSFRQATARTGRLSCSDPNLQQVPGHLHKLFIARSGYKIIGQDLGNIEPICIAYLTECPELLDIVIKGRSFHNANTIVFFELDPSEEDQVPTKYKKLRLISKTLGLLLIYGGGPKRIQVTAMKEGIQLSLTQAKTMYDRFRKKYKAVFEYKKAMDSQAERGEIITNLLGRMYRIDDPADAYMKTLNTFIQGSASDMLVEAVTKASEDYIKLGLDAHPILLVHDEALIEVREDQAEHANQILLHHMLGYKLITKAGQIPMKAEGGIYDYWKK